MNKSFREEELRDAANTGAASADDFYPLEERILFDGAAAVEAADTLQDDFGEDAAAVEAAAHQEQEQAGETLASAAAEMPDAQANEIYFVDSGIGNAETLIAAIPDGAEVVMIDANTDGVEQIATVLEGRNDVEAIHILSHGQPGQIELGNTILDAATITGTHADELAVIGAALSENADILIYGCDFGKDEATLMALADATGADVAASDDDTGNETVGGDWILEAQFGTIEASVFSQPAWTGVLADADGDTVDDSVDIDDDNDGILDVVEQTVTFTELSNTTTYSFAQNNLGDLAQHYPSDLSLPGDDNPLNLFDGDPDTELRMHSYDVFEYDFGQVIPAGTSVTLVEGLGGEDTGIAIYVSLTSADPNGDTLAALGTGSGTGYANTIANSTLIVVPTTDVSGTPATNLSYGVTPADASVTFIMPEDARFLQLIGDPAAQHGGWAELEFTTLTQTIANLDSDGDGLPDHLDIDKDNDGITDNVEAQTTAGYIAPSGQGTGIIDADGDGLDDNYDANAGNIDTTASAGLSEVDTDGDGTVDTLDLDSDDDGTLDVAERGDGGPTATPTGPTFADADNDGLLDAFEGASTTDGFDVNDENIVGDDGGADGDYTNFTLGDSDLDTNANAAVLNRTSNDAEAQTTDLDYRDNDPDSDLDGIQDSVDVDDDNDGILDVVEQTVTYELLETTATVSGDEKFNGDSAGNNDLTFLIDGDSGTEPEIGKETVVEYDLGQTLLAGTQISFTEGTSGNDGNVEIYVSYGTLGPGLKGAIDSGGGMLLYSGPADGDLTLTTTIDATHIQIVSLDDKAGWVSMELTSTRQVIATRDSDGDGVADHLDIDKDNDGITDNVEAQTTAGYVAPSGQGADMVDTNNDGLDDNYDAGIIAGSVHSGVGLSEVDTDGDGIFDTLDSDSDDDGVADVAERGDGGPTATPTGPTFADADNDGLLDAFEGASTTDGFDVNDENIAGDNGGAGADADYTNFALSDSDLDTNANEAVLNRTSNDAVVLTTDLDYRDNDNDTDGDGVQDSVDIDDDNDGILDVVEQTVTFTELSNTTTYSFAQNNLGDLAQHYPSDLSLPGDDNPLNLFDGDPDTELRMHSYDVFEYDFGQVIPAGTSVTLVEGLGGEDTGIAIYVSLTSADPNGDTLAALGTGSGTGYANTIANSTLIVVPTTDVSGTPATNLSYGVTPADASVTFIMPEDARFLQLIGDPAAQHGGWAELEFTTLTQTIANLDSDGDGLPDHLDIDKDNDGITDNVEAQTTAGYIAPSGQGTGIIDADGDGLDDNYDANAGNIDTTASAGLSEVDTDGDGTVDTLDLDSDDDGTLDVAERGDGGPTATPTGPTFADADNDGLLDAFEGASTTDGFDVNDENIVGDDGGADGDYTNFTLGDSDLDTNANAAVLNRTSNDAEAQTTDLDYRDNDPDSDLDGIQDSVDVDDDNDGILDVVEQTVTYELLETTATVSGDEKFNGDSAGNNDLTFLIDGDSGTEPEIGKETVVEYDLGQTLLAGTQISFTEGTSGNDGNVEIYVSYGTLGPGLKGAIDSGGGMLLYSGPADGDLTLTTTIDATHIQIVSLDDKAGWVSMELTSTRQVIATRDSDGDGVADHLDIDKDNDGITDNVEAQTTAGYVAPSGQGADMVDTNNDGLDDNYDAGIIAGSVHSGVGLSEVDTDGDGIFDTLDSDSDDDGVADVAERGDGGPTATPTGPTFADADNDGLLDAFEGASTTDGFDVNDENIAGDNGGADGDYTNFALSDSDRDTNANEAVTGRTSNNAVALGSDLDFRDNRDDPFTNTPPVANNDSFATDEDTTSAVIDILGNDTDADGDALSIFSIASITRTPGVAQSIAVSNGTVLVSASGDVTFSPSANYNGAVGFDYVVSDGFGGTAAGTVNGVVIAIGDPATFGGDTGGTGDEDGSITGTLTVSDAADGMTAPNFTIGSGDGPTNGTATIDLDTGEWEYTPNADYNGNDSFTVSVTDDDGNTETQVINVTVEAVVDIAADTDTTDEDTSVTTVVLTNDSFEGTPVVSVASGDAPSNGSVVVNADNTITYTPNANYNGTDQYTYTVTSGGVTESTTVLITVNQINDPATFGGDTGGTGDEDGSITGTLTVSDAADGMTAPNFTIGSGDGPTNGTATIDLDTGEWEYTPNADYNGNDSFTVSVTDDDGNTETQVINVTVEAVVDIAADTDTTDEDTSVTTVVLTNDSFEGTPVVSVASGDAPSNGSVVVNADNTITYTPNANYNGTDQYTYTVTSGGVTESTTVLITVNQINDPATFGGDTGGTGDEDGSITGTLTVSDAADGMTAPNFTIGSGDGPTNGTATIDLDTGEWEYTPNADYNGNDSFTVSVTDDDGNTETQVINVTVEAVVDIAADTDTTDEDTSVTTVVLTNDSFEGTPVVSVASGDAPSNGSVVVNADNTITYTPNANYNGTDQYTYTVTSGGVTESTTVLITVNQINDPATFGGDTGGTGDEDGSITGTLTVSDAADGMTAPNFTIGSGDGPTNGTATIDLDTGEWEYTPNADYNGNDSFTVSVTDDDGNTETQVINVTVEAVVDIAADTDTTDEDTSVTTVVLTNDSFEGTPVVSVASGDAPSNGSVVVNADNTITYTPNANYNGTDQYTYTVTSGGVTESTTVLITVNQINDPATFGGDTGGTGDEDGSITGTLTVSDAADGMTAPNFTIGSGDGPTNGTATIDLDTGEWEYTPNADYNGNDSFTVSVTDDDGNTETQVINVTVEAVVDIAADTDTTDEDTSVTTVVLTNDSFEGTPVVSVASGDAPSNGSVVVNADNTITYTPNANYNGTDQYTYTVTSGGVTESTTVLITVNQINDPATFGGDTGGTGDEDGSITGTLTVSDAADGMTAPNFTIGSGDGPTNGTATIDLDTGEWEYTPNADYNGNDSFTVSVTDDDGNTETQVINVTVEAVVDIAADTDTTDEDTSVTTVVLTNDSFEGTPVVSVASGDAPSNGSVVVNADNTITYTPNANYNGTDQYTYTVTSGGVTESTTVLITVNQINDPATFGGDTGGTGDEDGSITGTLTVSDAADGMTAPNFTIGSGDGPTNGTATIDLDTGEWEYTPNADYNGNDSFTVSVTDDDGNTETQVINVTVEAVVDIAADTDTTDEDTSVTTVVLTNDSFEGTPVVSVASGDAPSNGSVVVNADNTITYTPNANYNGTDQYTYTVTSGGVTESTTVLITVNQINDPATFGGDTGGTGDEDGSITGTLTVSDAADGMTAPNFTIGSGDGPTNGTATIDLDTGEWEYTPNADYNGNDSFTVSVTDDDGNTETQVINVTVEAVVDIAADTDTTDEDTSVTTVVLTNDSFEGTPVVSVASGDAPSNGSVVVNADNTITYTPNANYNGTDQYTYTVTSGGVTESTTVLITVNQINDPATFGGDTGGTGDEDGSITGTLTVSDAADGMTAPNFTIGSGDGPTNGTATIDLDTGEWEYTPNADYNGNDSFTVSVTDDDGNTETQVINVTVEAVVDIAADTDTTDEDTSVTTVVLTNDSFEGTPVVSVASGDAPSNGSVVVNADNTITYTPNANYNGTDQYTYTVTSGGVTESTTVLITVNQINDPATFGGDTGGTGDEDGSITGTLTVSDAADGMTAPNFTIGSGDGPTNGTATIDLDTGEWEYTPNADYNGNDSFTVSVTDDDGNTETQVINVTVEAVVDIAADTDTTDEDTSVTTVVLTNDSFEGTPVVSVASGDAPSNGSVVVNADNTITYTPNANYNGTDQYTYTVTSGGVTESTTVLITVNQINDPATFGGDTGGTGDEDGSITGTLTVSDAADGMTAPNFTIGSGDGPTNGTATIDLDTGEWEYTPNADYNGNDSFTVSVTDDDGNTETQVINVTVEAVVDIAADTDTTDEDTSVTTVVLTNDSFEGTPVVSVASGDAPSNGSVVVNADNTITYTPNANYNGTDQYTYTVTSGGVTESTTVLITVNQINDPATFGGDTGGTGDEDGSITGTLTVSDAADGMTAPNFTIGSGDGPTNGTATIDLDTGEWEYTPNADYNGNDSFTVSVTDDDGNTETQVINVTVEAVVDIAADTDTTDEDTSVTTVVLTNDSFEGTPVVSVASGDAPSNGSVVVNADNTITYTPNANYNGTDQYTYTVTSGGVTESTTVLITVNQINDPATFGGDTGGTGDEDGSITGTLTVSDAADGMTAPNFTIGSGDGPTNGTATIDLDTGEWEYTPNADYNGNDSFTVSVTDDDGNTETQVINVTVEAVVDIAADTDTTDEDTSVTTVVLTNDSFEGTPVVSVASGDAPSNGSVVVNADNTITYTPNANYNGTDQYTYTVTSGGVTESTTVLITVNQINDPATFGGDTGGTGDEDGSITGTLTVSDAADGMTAPNFTIGSGDGPTNGTATIDLDTGEWEYTPNADYNGNDSFTVSVTDDDGNTETQVINVTVEAVVDIAADTDTTDEDTSVTTVVLTNDSFEGTPVVSVASGDAPSNGSVVVNADNTITYTPNANYNGTDQYTYTVTSGGVTESTTVLITVNQINDPATFGGDTGGTGDEDGSITGTLTVSDAADGMTAPNFTIGSGDGPTNGTATIDLDTGEWEYTPNADYNGNDSFTVSVTDDDGNTETQVINVTVEAVVDIAADTDTTDEDTSVTTVVLTNDSFEGTPVVSVASGDAPSNGSVVVNADNTITYTPNANYNGTDQYTYTVTSGGVTESTTVLITVNQINDPATFGGDTGGTGDEDGSITGTLTVSDAADGMTAPNFTIGSGDGPTNGTATIDLDTGEWEYTPNADYNGNDSFTVSVTDDDGNTETQVINVTVEAVVDIAADTDTTDEDTSVTTVVLTNDSFEGTPVVSVASGDAPSNGSVVVNADNTITYTPNANYNGTDQYTYTVTSGGVTESTTVLITVNQINDPATFGGDTGGTGDEDGSITGTLTVSDAADGMTAPNFTIGSGDGPTNGTATIDLDTGEWEYTPNADYNGNDSFTVSVTDDDGNTETQVINVTVEAVVDIAADTDTTDEDTSVTTVVLTNDSFEGTPVVSVASGDAPSNGSVVVNADNTITYTPNANYNGTDQYTYTVTSGGVTESTTVLITVNQINDPATFGGDTGGTGDEDGSITGTLTVSDAADGMTAPNFTIGSGDGPTNGTATIDLDTGEWEYTPNADYNGNDSFTVSVTDDDGNTETQVINVTVEAVVDIAADTDTTDEDTSVTTVVLTNDSFEGTPVVSVASGDAPSNGSVVVNADNTITYTPNANYNGTDQYTYTVTSGGVTESTTVLITVNQINDPATFGGDTGGTGDEDGSITGTLTVSDAADGMTAPNFTIGSGDGPTNGTATIDLDTGEWEYTPNADYNGNDSFTVSVTDDDGNTETQVINVTVEAVVDIAADTDTTDEDTSVTTVVLTNDSFEGTPVVSVASGDAPSNGSVVVNADNTITYTPNANYNGTDQYTYTVTSGGVTESTTVLITVNQINDPATFGGDTGGTGDEDGSITGTLTVSDAADGMTAPNFTIGSGDGPTNGTATIDLDTGEWEYTPNADYNGNDSFTVSVTDDDGNTETQVINVTVEAVVDIAADTDTTDEDTSVTTVVLTNDSFEGTPVVSVASGDAPSNGSVVVNADNTITYTPNANYNGTDQYTYTVTSGGVTESTTVLITVNQINDPATFGGDTGGTGDEDGSITGTLTVSDAADGMTAPNFTIGSGDGPTNGTATIDLDTGEWEYTPNADYNGNDSFTVSVTDDDGNTETQVINVTVEAVVDIAADTDTTDEDTSVTTVVLTNDSFEGTPVVSVASGDAPSNGSVVVNADNTITYTPNANYNGTDQYTYTVTSGGVTESTTVLITVNQINDPATFGGDTGGTGDEDGSITGTLTVSDAADGMTAPNFTIGSGDGPTNGTATIDLDTGEWEYTPNADYNGNDSFTVSVTDDDGNTETQVINVTVEAVVDIAADTDTTDEDTSVTTVVLTNDSFEGTPVVSVASGDAPSNGSVVVNADNTITYTPNANYNGTDQYTYTVTSGGVTESTTVLITVNQINDPATFGGDTGGTGDEDGSITGTLTVSDAADGMTAPNFTIGSGDGPTNGTATIDLDTGEWEYTPNADYNGNDSFTVSVTDDDGNTETQVINVTVEAVVDIAADTDTTDEDTSVTTVVLTNDSFEGTPVVSVASGDAPSNGSVVVNADNTITYTPNANYNGTDQYTYTVTSGGVTESTTVLITVNQINDPATFGGDTGGTGDEDGSITGTLTVSDAADGMTAPNFTIGSGDGPTNGTATIDLDTGEWEYTPNADYNGNDSFTVSVTDDDGNTETQVINVTVEAVVDIAADTDTTDEDTSVTTVVLTNDSFEGTPVVSVASGDAPSNGSVVVNADNTITYTPNANYNGTDQYTYTVTSGGVTESTTVLITVNQINDPATFGGDTGGTGDEDGSITGTLTVSDAADGMTAPNFTIGSGDGPTNGTATIDLDTGEWEYTPNADYNGNDSFTVSVTDDDGNTETQVINVTVEAVVDIAADTDTTDEDTSVTTVVLTNDSFEGTPVVSVASGDAPSNGSVVVNADNTITYTPNANYNGTDQYTYTVTSGGVTESTTVLITVNQINDPATFGGDTGRNEAPQPEKTPAQEREPLIVDHMIGEAANAAGNLNGITPLLSGLNTNLAVKHPILEALNGLQDLNGTPQLSTASDSIFAGIAADGPILQAVEGLGFAPLMDQHDPFGQAFPESSSETGDVVTRSGYVIRLTELEDDTMPMLSIQVWSPKGEIESVQSMTFENLDGEVLTELPASLLDRTDASIVANIELATGQEIYLDFHLTPADGKVMVQQVSEVGADTFSEQTRQLAQHSAYETERLIQAIRGN